MNFEQQTRSIYSLKVILPDPGKLFLLAFEILESNQINFSEELQKESEVL
jgi:hypothetical protein